MTAILTFDQYILTSIEVFFIVFFIENTYSSSNFINYPKFFSWKCNNFNEISFNNYNDTLGLSYNHKHNHLSNNIQLLNIKNNFTTQILNNDLQIKYLF